MRKVINNYNMADLGRRDYLKMGIITVAFIIGALSVEQVLDTEEPSVRFENPSVVSETGNEQVISRTTSGEPSSLGIRFESLDLRYQNLKLESNNPVIQVDITGEITSPNSETDESRIFTDSFLISQPDERIDIAASVGEVDIISEIVENPSEFFNVKNASSKNYDLTIRYSADISGVDDEEDINAEGQYNVPISVINQPE